MVLLATAYGLIFTRSEGTSTVELAPSLTLLVGPISAGDHDLIHACRRRETAETWHATDRLRAKAKLSSTNALLEVS